MVKLTATLLLLAAAATYVTAGNNQSQQLLPNGAFNYQYTGPIAVPPGNYYPNGYYWYEQPSTLAPLVNTSLGPIQGLVTNNGTVHTYYGRYRTAPTYAQSITGVNTRCLRLQVFRTLSRQ